MEGARFVKVEARRGDLRWPLPKDFVSRLEGQTVTGLGRRAKYLLADLSSGDVLLMHLGMSGSFRVMQAGGEEMPGDFHHERSKLAAHDHIVFHMSNGGVATFKSARDVRETAEQCPDGTFLLETDSPYLAPEPHRGKRNEPAFTRLVAERLAALRGQSLEELAAHVRAATDGFFRFR